MTKTLLNRAAALALCAFSGSSLVLAQQAPPPQAAPSTPPPPARDMNAFYTLGPDSLEREGVPKGELRGPFVLPNRRPIRARSTPTGSTCPPSTIRPCRPT